MTDYIEILNTKYQILDTLEYITLADSAVLNKIGSGHGEGKIYVGNQSERLFNFFEGFEIKNTRSKGFVLKKDFNQYLKDSKSEFKKPQQEYVRKTQMPIIYEDLMNESKELPDKMDFEFFRSEINPPRIYINSLSPYYRFMRKVGLPNISYISILKLMDDSNKIEYYFKIFVDYDANIEGYTFSEDEEEEKRVLEDEHLSENVKATLVKSRRGQGDYRNKLLEEFNYCPFTGINDERLLIASHIKPWAKSDNTGKIDPNNGFIFSPTYDKLFDQGFITFNLNSTLEVSPWISPMNQKRLKIKTGMKMTNLCLNKQRLEYLEYHKEEVFKS